MIDLHIHSKYSMDGSDSLEKILETANEKKLDVISITDHDSVGIYEEMFNKNIKKYYSGKIIPGAEINCYLNGIKIELLVYGFNYKKIKKWMNEKYNMEKQHEKVDKMFKILMDKVKENNILIEQDLKPNYETDRPFRDIWENIIKFPDNKEKITEPCFESFGNFFREITANQNYILYVVLENIYPSAEEIINTVRNFGGKVFLAHLYKYKLPDHISYLNRLIDLNLIDGIECYHYSFSDKQCNTLLEVAKKNNLLISGGTDYHGINRPEIEMGTGNGNMNIPLNILKQWNLSENNIIK